MKNTYRLKDIFDENVEDVKGSIVYRIYNAEKDKSYVGSSVNGLFSRFNTGFSHRKRVGNFTKRGMYLDMKSNIDDFFVEILFHSKDKLDRNTLYDKEQEFISKLNPEYNYNKIVRKISLEFYKEIGKKGAEKCYELGVGWHSSQARENNKIARRESGLFRSELQSVKGKLGGIKRQQNMRENGENFFNSEIQTMLSNRSLEKKLLRIINDVYQRELELTEETYNKEREKYKAYPTYSTLINEKNKYLLELSKDEVIEKVSTFESVTTYSKNESKYEYNPKRNSVESRLNKFLKEILQQYGKITEHTYKEYKGNSNKMCRWETFIEKYPHLISKENIERLKEENKNG